jgi:DNA-binding MarR family transcriptional regulator/N-acetylglutamate synthase-like GNAT family acetyltransferase
MATRNDFRSLVDSVRSFNRFYTQQIGVLSEGVLRSRFSLTEVRVMYELAHRERSVASQIAKELGLDPAYLSRVLRRFEKDGLIRRVASKEDARASVVVLTKKGAATFAGLNKQQDADVRAMLEHVRPERRAEMVRAMETIRRALSGDDQASKSFVLRPPRVGDLGWVVHRHGALYAQEYGWNERFEALVAEIVADFVKNFEAKRERCWIAERDGEIVGSVFVVKKSKTVAKLRMLYVEPSARGLGIGRRLVEECIQFARQCGYKKMTLWTQSVLHSARKIYQAAGFKLVREGTEQEPFGDHVGMPQVWEMEL